MTPHLIYRYQPTPNSLLAVSRWGLGYLVTIRELRAGRDGVHIITLPQLELTKLFLALREEVKEV